MVLLSECINQSASDRTRVTGSYPEPVELQRLSQTPRCSVLVANFNYGRFLGDVYESLVTQTYQSWELIICDDGSTDCSRNVIRNLEAKDSRVRGVFKENGGQASAWNHAFEVSTGELIAFLDADDRYSPQKLERVIAAFRDNPDCGMVHHRLQRITRDERPIGGLFPRYMPAGWLWPRAANEGGVAVQPSTAIVLRREVASYIFPLPNLRISGDAYLTMAASTLTMITSLPEALTYYRIHGDNHSGAIHDFGDPGRSIDRWIEAYIEAFEHYRLFLYGMGWIEAAHRVDLRDVPVLSKYLPASYALHARPVGGVHGFSRDEILNLVRPRLERLFWSLTFRLPGSIVRNLILLALMIRQLTQLMFSAGRALFLRGKRGDVD
jgi:glycosyltransferase involved in cell wall biosynthesis